MNHPGVSNAGRIAAIAFALFAVLALTSTLVGGQAEAAKKRAKPARVAVKKVVTKNQAQLLRQKRLVVRVRANRRVAVRLSVVSGGKKNLFRAKRVRFKKRGVKKVSLRLTARGRKRLGRCGAKVVRVRADYRRRVGKKVRKARASKKKRLAKSASRCAKAPQLTLNRAAGQASPTNQSPVRFSFSSNKKLNASTVTAADFSVTNASIAGVSGSGTTFTVTAEVSSSGEVAVSPAAGFSVKSADGATQTKISGGTDRTVVFDNTPPTVTLERADGQGPVTNEKESIKFALSADEGLDSSTVTAGDFSASNGTIKSVAGSSRLFEVVVEAQAEGDVVIAPSSAFSVSDELGNAQTSAGGTERTVEFDANWRFVPLGDDPEHCDFLDQTVCLQPFPNDYYTKNDPSTETGKRLALGADATPANTDGKHIDVTDINRADGFSPGNMIMIKIPGLDTPEAFENTGLVPLDDITDYKRPDQPVVVIDAATGERQPIWAELDSNPTTVDPSDDGPGGIDQNPGNTDPVNLLIRPAKNFEFGHRYIVAFRDLKDADDQPIPAPLGFEVYRDNLRTTQDPVEDRRPHMESIIDTLTDEAGVDRSSLYMAWDFTIASEENVTGRATTIRDDAFERLGDTDLSDRTMQGDSPVVDVEAWCDADDPGDSDCGDNYPGRGPKDFDPEAPITSPVPGEDIKRTVVGYVRDVPCYLDQDGCPPGSQFAFDSNGDLTWNSSYTMDVPFRCVIPESAVAGGTLHPGGTGTYGHGLLGTLSQINSAVEAANRANSTFCAANWDGFSDLDIGVIISALRDMSNFKKAADRMQQGFVNFMYLQRAMAHPDGFAAEPAFQIDPDEGGPELAGSVIDTSQDRATRGYYYGISQGGIMGGALTALSPDVDRGVLGVPGINYSTLLRRSVDSDEYFKLPGLGLYANYPDLASRPALLSVIQLLWDRGEGNGYAHNLTDDPLPNTNPHEVLLQLALGDHQVTNFAAEVEARTIGALRYSPTLQPSRTWDLDYEALPPTTSFPSGPGESFMVYYDGGPPDFIGTQDPGTAVPPLQNVPPRPEWGFGEDPHGFPRRAPDGNAHIQSFYADGTIDSCETTTPTQGGPGDAHCYSNGWDGTSGL